MNLFVIGRALWRYKWVSGSVLVLTVLVVAYVLAIRPAAFQADAGILLTDPPTPPTTQQIAQDPGLARLSNPYESQGSVVPVAYVLVDAVSSAAAGKELAQEGVSSGYQVAVNDSDNSLVSPPAIDITGTGASPQAAMRSAQLVVGALSRDLLQMQASQHVESAYMISTVEYLKPTTATESSSGKVRTAAGVAVVGLLLLLAAVSAAQGLEQMRSSRSHQGKRSYAVDGYRESADRSAMMPRRGAPQAPTQTRDHSYDYRTK